VPDSNGMIFKSHTEFCSGFFPGYVNVNLGLFLACPCNLPLRSFSEPYLFSIHSDATGIVDSSYERVFTPKIDVLGTIHFFPPPFSVSPVLLSVTWLFFCDSRTEQIQGGKSLISTLSL